MKKNRLRVLVMARTIDSNLWEVEYSGEILAETTNMYFVLRDGFWNRLFHNTDWIPKDGFLIRCDIIGQSKYN